MKLEGGTDEDLGNLEHEDFGDGEAGLEPSQSYESIKEKLPP